MQLPQWVSLPGFAPTVAAKSQPAASRNEASQIANASIPSPLKASSFPTLLDALFEEQKPSAQRPAQSDTPASLTFAVALDPVAIALDPTPRKANPTLTMNLAWEKKATGQVAPELMLPITISTNNLLIPALKTVVNASPDVGQAVTTGSLIVPKFATERPAVATSVTEKNPNPIPSVPLAPSVDSDQMPKPIGTTAALPQEPLPLQGQEPDLAHGSADPSIPGEWTTLVRPQQAQPFGLPGQGIAMNVSEPAAIPQPHDEGELLPLKDVGRVQAAVLRRAVIKETTRSKREVDLDTLPDFPEMRSAAAPPESSPALQSPAPTSSAISAPFKIYTPPPVPTTAPNAPSETHTPSPRLSSGLESSATQRPLRDVATDEPRGGRPASEPNASAGVLSARLDEQDTPQPLIEGNATSQPSFAEIAFRGRLVPVSAPDVPVRTSRIDSRTSTADKPFHLAGLSALPEIPRDSAGEEVVRAIESTEWSGGQADGNSHQDGTPAEPGDGDPHERVRKSETARATDGETASAAASRTVFEPIHSIKDRGSDNTMGPKAEPTPQPDRAQPQLGAAAAKPSASRDLRLEVNSGDQRVEVHLVERGGDVHVSVRTPDTHLAGELRENLPALSSRLEQTGFRAEEWHTTTPASGEWHRQTEHSAGGSANDSNGQQGQHAHERKQDPEPRAPKVIEEQPNRKGKGKEFAWFMSSLH